jgi:uncharacterized damage-inducible protein DinB
MVDNKTTSPPQPEPWLRGTHAQHPAVVRAVVHALELAREDVRKWCGELTDAELDAQPHGLPSIASQLRHIVRSIDRLLSYAEGAQLSASQLSALKSEMDGGATRAELFAEFESGLDSATQRALAFGSADLEEARGVGKRQLPTTVGGLLVHVADHTQRHVGQAITTAKMLAAQREP